MTVYFDSLGEIDKMNYVLFLTRVSEAFAQQVHTIVLIIILVIIIRKFSLAVFVTNKIFFLVLLNPNKTMKSRRTICISDKSWNILKNLQTSHQRAPYLLAQN